MPEAGLLKIKKFLKTSTMLALSQSLKKDGLKKTIARYGWKFFLIGFFCYLIRDVVIYVIIPVLIAHGLKS